MGLHIHAQVTDNYGCVGITPDPASGYASCPAPPDAFGNGALGTVATCNSPDSSVTLSLSGIPEGGVWSVPEGILLGDSTATAPPSEGNNYINLQYTITSDLGCPSTAGLCWIEAAEDSTETCDIPEICDNPLACNYNFPPLWRGWLHRLPDCPPPTSCTIPVFCQSDASHALVALQPNMGPGDGGDQCRRHLEGAWLSLASPGEWYVYFEGGFGNCTSLDSVHVTIHPAPIHERLDYLSACGGSTLDFSFDATGTGGVCWSFNWYDQGLPACSDSTTWEVNETGFVEWVVTDSLGCQSGMVFELVDLGGPNALAGGDTTLCLGSTPNIMEFEFGGPLALGCNRARGRARRKWNTLPKCGRRATAFNRSSLGSTAFGSLTLNLVT